MDLGLAGRVAIVTGGSKGIGRAIARELGHEGARVAITYCHDLSAAETTAALIRDEGGDAVAFFLDLADPASIDAAAAATLARWGRIDVLVNNAIAWGAQAARDAPPLDRLPPAEWRQLLRANVEGPVAALQSVIPSMRQNAWGRIVNISSVSAVDGLRGAGWYSAAKAALHGLTRTVAREVGTAGILINCVMPSLTLTDGVLRTVPESVRESTAARTPIGRLLSPSEFAQVVVFLCSAANVAITGEVIRASGGL